MNQLRSNLTLSACHFSVRLPTPLEATPCFFPPMTGFVVLSDLQTISGWLLSTMDSVFNEQDGYSHKSERITISENFNRENSRVIGTTV